MSFSPVPINTTTTTLDPSKHVNYTLGMILGVDDLNQDFAYLSNRSNWIVRDLIGYGTACGLQVTQDASDVNKGPSITVSPGVALNPIGQFIRVTPAQCAYLNAWLNSAKIKPTVAGNLNEGGGTTVYLKLCYRDCQTDSVPVPGEACRTEDSGDLVVPSRVQDDFSLDFSFTPVDQTEENGLRLFVAWLRQIPIAAAAAVALVAAPVAAGEKPKGRQPSRRIERKLAEAQAATSLDQFLDALRTAAKANFANPPDASLALDADAVTDYLRAAFLVWTTEIRSSERGQDADCVTPSTESCVLLAAINFSISGAQETGWAVNGAVTLDETNRPYLLHLRMLQEWLLTASAQLLSPDDTKLVSETSYSQTAAAGTSDHYARADHTHGTPQDPIPAHKADAAAHNLVGDVSGTVGVNLIQNLQRQPVKAETPVNGQLLGYVVDHWEPVNPPKVNTQGTFVLRPPKATDYSVSAAGRLTIDGSKPFITVDQSYYGLSVDVGTIATGLRFGMEFNFTFFEFDPKKAYVVKLTPWPNREMSPYIAWVVSIDDKGVRVGLGCMPSFKDAVMGQLMIEVCEFN